MAESGGRSADGLLRFEYRHDTRLPNVVLSDAANGRVLVDCGAWSSSEIRLQADGSLFLHLTLDQCEALFRIDPRAWRFRDLGENGPDRRLAELADTVEQAHGALTHYVRTMGARQIAPDGTVRVDLTAQEWSNSHWVFAPKVIEIATGRVVLDLWNTDWDATVSFPARNHVRLDLRRYTHRGNQTVDLDLARNTYRIVREQGIDTTLREAPLHQVAAGLEESSRRLAADPAPDPPPPQRWRQWRTALLILLAALAAIGIATAITLRFFPPAEQTLTPLPGNPPISDR